MKDSRVQFPITVRFEDGESEVYEDFKDLELNLEDFDSTRSADCAVTDALGRQIRLKIHLQVIEELQLVSE